MRFHHVALSVADLDRSIAFYRDHFGMEKLVEPFPFEGEWYQRIMAVNEPQGRMVVVGNGAMSLELFEFTSPSPRAQDPDYPVSDRGITHFGLEVDNIDEIYGRMAAAGVKFHCPVQCFAGATKATYGRDPDGNVFEMVEMVR